jgi:hypothetical protein
MYSHDYLTESTTQSHPQRLPKPTKPHAYEKSSRFSSIAFFTLSRMVVFHLSNLLI